MSDYLHAFDQIAKFGDPWHGLYRFGRQELPNSTTRVPAVAPTGGDVFEIRVPGQAAVSNELDDNAAGRTWLNYGIMAGANHVLYGTALGDMSWVYVAADKTCYKATASVSNVDSVSVTLVPLVGTAPTQTITGVSMDQGISVNGSLLVIHKIMDISPDGRKVVISHHYSNNPDFPHAASLLELSGNLPSVTATRTLLLDIYNANPAISGNETTDNRVVTLTYQERIRNNNTNDEYTREFSSTQADWDSGAGYPALPPGYHQVWLWLKDSSRSGVVTVFTRAGYVFVDGTLTPVKFKNTTTDTTVGWTDPYPGANKTYHGSYVRAQSVQIGTQESTPIGQSYAYSGSNNVATQTSGNGECYYRRYSNRTYGITEPITNPTTFTRHHPPISPTGQATGTPVDGQPPYATYQPVTQAIAWHSQTNGVICFL